MNGESRNALKRKRRKLQEERRIAKKAKREWLSVRKVEIMIARGVEVKVAKVMAMSAWVKEVKR